MLKFCLQTDDPGSDALLRWLRTFIIHFTSKRTLERQCLTLKGEFDISLLVMEPPKLQVKASWQDIEAIISESIPSIHSSATGMISMASKILKKKSAEASQRIKALEQSASDSTTHTGSVYENLVATFQSIAESDTVLSSFAFSGGLHCGTILGVLAQRFADDLQGKGNSDLVSLSRASLAILIFLARRTNHYTVFRNSFRPGQFPFRRHAAPYAGRFSSS